MKTTAIEMTQKIVKEICTQFESGELSQGQAITEIQSLASLLERCVNKHNVPGDGAQDKNLQRRADKQFPYFNLLDLDLNPETLGK